jgi:competence protein ComEA
MRTRPTHDERVAEVTRRRLEALIAELGRGGDDPDGDERIEAPLPTEDPATGGRHARRSVPPGRRSGDWLHDHLPVPLQGRAHLGSAQIGVVCLVLAVGLVVAAWWLVRAAGVTGDRAEVVAPRAVAPAQPSAPSPVAVTPPAPAEPGASPPGSETTSGLPVPSGDQIVVDVVGKVREPGIAVLPAGSRVVDAVRAAGGLRPGVRPGSVNLARLLTDGEQVLVGTQPASGSPAASALASTGAPASGALVNLNTADQAALESLPGVGPVTAAAILQWRTEHGGFTSVDELLEVDGIGEVTLGRIAPFVTV